MKKIFPVLILFLCAMLVWNLFISPGDIHFDLDDADFDGPVGAIAAVLFAGGGLLIGALVTLFVGAVLAVVFAGLGVIFIGAIALGAVVLAALLSPLLLPVLIPVAIIWFLMRRSKKNRTLAVPV